jgi:hypothetical protein
MKVSKGIQDDRLVDNQEHLKRLNNSLEKKITSKEIEIKKIGELYDTKVDIAKTAGEEKYVDALNKNQKRILDESLHVEEKIENYRDQLAKVHQTVENEKQVLKDNHRINIDNTKAQLDSNFNEQITAAIDSQREIVSNTQNSVKELTTQSKSDKTTLESNAQYEINALSSGFNQKKANSESTFKEQMENDVRLHTAELTRQRNDLQKIMKEDTEKFKRLEEEKTRIQKDQLLFLDKHQQGLIKQRQDDFKTRYEKLVTDNTNILKDLEKNFNADVKKMAEKTAKDKAIYAEKMNDDFYRIDRLNPKMQEGPKEVIVTLPVAEYEKENVHLSTQGRGIKITMSRKYNDTITDASGGIDRSTRSELYSKELTTVDLLSPRGITQHYEDGNLIFKILKA